MPPVLLCRDLCALPFLFLLLREDLYCRRLPTRLQRPLLLLWLLVLPFLPRARARALYGLLAGLLFGGALLLCRRLFGLPGAGDVRLLTLAGLYLGPFGGCLLLLAAVPAALGAALREKKSGGRGYFPLGPPLISGWLFASLLLLYRPALFWG